MNIIIANKSRLIGEGVGLVIKSSYESAQLTISHSEDSLVDALLHGTSSPKNLLLIDRELARTVTPKKVTQLSPGTKICLMPSAKSEDNRPIRRGFDQVLPTFATSDDLLKTIHSMVEPGELTSTRITPTHSPKITRRQKDILRLLSKGLSNKEIAAKSHLAEGTVKRHLCNIFKALGAKSRLEAVRIARLKALL